MKLELRASLNYICEIDLPRNLLGDRDNRFHIDRFESLASGIHSHFNLDFRPAARVREIERNDEAVSYEVEHGWISPAPFTVRVLLEQPE